MDCVLLCPAEEALSDVISLQTHTSLIIELIMTVEG